MTEINHAFSIAMKSDKHIRNLYFRNMSNEVLFEGFLGLLTSVKFVEDLMLEIQGENGVIRIDLTKDKILKALKGSEVS